MSTLSSLLSDPLIATIATRYTTAALVSQVTGGEVLPEEVEDQWIDWAEQEIDRRTNDCFQAQNFTDLLDGNGLDTIFTRCFPVLEIFQVSIDDKVLDPSKYVVNFRTGSIRLKDSLFFPGVQNVFVPPITVNMPYVANVFRPGVQNVVVSGIYGYRTVPPLIQKIATLIVAKTALSGKSGALVDNESIGRHFTQTRTFKKLNDELDRAWKAWGQRFPIDFV